jgi:hypothetical protein
MATLVRIDDLYINLDTVAYIRVEAYAEEVTVHFATVAESSLDGSVVTLYTTLRGEQGARLLKWLDAGGRVGEA